MSFKSSKIKNLYSDRCLGCYCFPIPLYIYSYQGIDFYYSSWNSFSLSLFDQTFWNIQQNSSTILTESITSYYILIHTHRNRKKMASLTSNPIKDQLTAWCIRTDIVDQLTHALYELGVDTIEDFSFMETSDIDTFCNDQQLRMLDRRKLRNGYDALIASTASSSIAKSTTSISTAGQSIYCTNH